MGGKAAELPHATPASTEQSSKVQKGQKWVALAFWVLAFAAYQWYAWQNDLSPLDVVQRLIDFFSTNFYGPLLFILIYTLRPLLLFPATLLTIAAGFVFGPILGVVLIVIGSNASALLAYVVGRFFGQGLLSEGKAGGIVQRYTTRLREHSFETVFLLRLLFAPYDLVNYLAGFLRIRWVPFIVATALGALPGTLAFTLFGASIERFDGGIPALNPWVLAASVALFLVSLSLSRIIKRRSTAVSEDDDRRDAA
jgi:uncharacterized membrane protein YdjX (TVP38/TMEM64 family)